MQFTEQILNNIVNYINKEQPNYKIARFNKENSSTFVLEEDYFDKLHVLIYLQATKLKNANFIIANKRSLLNTLFVSHNFHLMKTYTSEQFVNISPENYHGTIAGMHILTSENLTLDKIYVGHTNNLSELVLINLE